MTQSYELAWAYVAAIAGDPNTAQMDWRCLSDTNPGADGHARRGTLPQWWSWLCAMNEQQHGCFVTPAEMDGQGRKLENVAQIRAHYIDNDGPDAQQQAERAAAAHPAPQFAVQSSPGKFHTYWSVQPYRDNARFTTVQRKLRTVFNGDPKVIDPTRVMRLPGTFHWKTGSPVLVTCYALPGYGQTTTVEALEAALQHVTVVEGGNGERKPVGDPEQAAPSLEWLQHALTLTDPNDLDRVQWIAFTAAWKQAGSTLAEDSVLRDMWLAWCQRYEGNDPTDNHKQWTHIRDTELGWKSLLHKVPSLRAMMSFGAAQQQPVAAPETPPMPTAAPPPLDCSGEYLTHLECEEWFKGCTFIVKLGQILAPDGRFLNSSQFNGAYGGKQFIITGEGKKTDEAWKAATRSTLWTVPKVDHVRFLPDQEHGAIVRDGLGRSGVNTYKAPHITLVDGDPAPFLAHIAALLPDPGDQRILLDYLAHNIKFPGFKIPWAPVIQSTEGAGKGVLKELVTHAFTKFYVHFPNAKELTNSGSQFNGWMRNKLFILADEIKVDDRRDLIEVLKPMISERLIEVQSKGVDQELEDNYANWCFFTNYKDAVPVSKNGRRYAIFYSPLQTEQDLLDRGMDEGYFNRLYGWLQGDGAAIVTAWFKRYPIERGAIPMRAPKTTSWDEAVAIGRTPIERVIVDAVSDGLSGFRNGWISSLAVTKRCRDLGAVKGNIQPQTIAAIVEGMGYVEIGRADRPWFQEDKDQRAVLFARSSGADVRTYGMAQGYE